MDGRMSGGRHPHHARDMAWPELRESAGTSIAVLPIGAMEPHGPHLPLASDTIISEYFARELADRVRAYVLPSLGYGVSTPPFRLGGHFPGVFATSGTTFTALVEDLLRGIHEHGTRDIVIVNSAIDNTSFLYEAARRHHQRVPDSRIMLVSWWDVVGEEFRDALAEETGVSRHDDHHAAMVESSLVAHMAPETVRLETVQGSGEHATRRIAYHMLPLPEECGTESGVVYRADKADAEIGARVAAQVTRNLVQAVREEFGPEGEER